MPKFRPVDYLNPEEIAEATRIRNSIAHASTINEIHMYESKLKNIIRVAYNRKKSGYAPKRKVSMINQT